MKLLAEVRDSGADHGGRLLSFLINTLYGRGGARPLHPVGEVLRARWTVTQDAVEPVGVEVCDRQGEWSCVIRRSRAIGLPDAVPDIEGFAVHIEGPSGGDLLLAGTGSGAVGRHMLVPRMSPGTCSTLVPMRARTGPLLLRVRPTSATADAWELSWVRPGGRWRTFGALTIEDDAAGVEPFNPVDGPPQGLTQYRTMTLLRRPAYVQAARQRT